MSLFIQLYIEYIMHKSVHKYSVPDSYTLLFIAKFYYLNAFCSHLRYVCMYVHMYVPKAP